jgi:diguanylate cyclase (GGDEF)-like protein/PAS domain S-box-containing protein
VTSDDGSLVEAVLPHLSELALVLDDEWTVQWAAPSVSVRLGYEPASVVGWPFFTLVHPDDQHRARASAAVTTLMGAVPDPLSVRLRHEDGYWPTFELNLARVEAAEGSPRIAVTGRDVSVQYELEERLSISEEWAAAVLDGSTEVLAVSNAVGVVTFVGGPLEELLGYRPDELVGSAHFDLIHPEDVGLAYQLLAQGHDGPCSMRVRHRDGDWRIVETVIEDMTGNEAVRGLVFRCRDVTRGQHVEEVLAEQTDLLEAIARRAPLEITLQRITQMVERVIDGSHCAIGVLDGDGAIRVRAAPHLPPDLVSFLDEFDLASIETGPVLSAPGRVISFDLRGGSVGGRAEVFLTHGYEACHVAAVTEAGNSEVVGALEVFHPVPRELTVREDELLERAVTLASVAIEQHRFATALEYQARHDMLTGLANRRLIEQRITEAVERSSRIGAGVAVLHIDLDRFKVVNDAMGHARGDELLRLVAHRFEEIVRPGDTLGRLSGDEFVVVCSRVLNEESARVAAERFRDGLAEPFVAQDGGDIFLSASIGIAYTADGTGTPETLLRAADVATYRAKDQGRNQYVVFQENVDQRALDLLAYEQALRLAIDRVEFEVHYQPVVRLADGAMTHVEALARWERPGHGFVPPAQFIPVAEESGLIGPLGWWVLDEACKEAAAWPRRADGRQVEVAVNLSARQLASPDLLPTIERVLTTHGLDPSRLCFEVTESALVRDVEQAKTALRAIKALGVNLAIDDFGTGYASLDYVRHFTMADYLKIDRAFVEGVDTPGSHEEAIVTAAIAMARSLGLTVIAEGVETEEQMEALRMLECELAQGFLFSRPVPSGDARALLGPS